MPDPPRILKAHALRGLGSKVVFNYDDLRRRCDEYVEQSRQQARQALDEARREAESIRRAAFDDAREEGRRQGQLDAEQEIQRRAGELADRMATERLSGALPALRQAAETLSRERQAWLASWEEAAIRLSVAVAGKLLRRKLAADPASVRPMVSAALELAAGSRGIRLRLNPEDVALLGGCAEDVLQSLACAGEAVLVPDAEIARGGCLIETQHGTVDARLEALLERIVDELLGKEG